MENFPFRSAGVAWQLFIGALSELRQMREQVEVLIALASGYAGPSYAKVSLNSHAFSYRVGRIGMETGPEFPNTLRYVTLPILSQFFLVFCGCGCIPTGTLHSYEHACADLLGIREGSSRIRRIRLRKAETIFGNRFLWDQMQNQHQDVFSTLTYQSNPLCK